MLRISQTVSALVLISSFASSGIGQESVAKEKPFRLADIQSRLVFRDKDVKTDEEINRRLIMDVDRRKVSFFLTEDSEKELKRLKASKNSLRSSEET